MTVFFSVDVETSNLTPWSPDGYLLTIGAVAVAWDPDAGTFTDVGEFYVRIDRSQLLDSYWYDQADDKPPSETAAWWRDQSSLARDEAWADLELVRHTDETAARMFSEFVRRLDVLYEHAYFVANPVAFDRMWIDELFATTGIDNPFHWRSLCLRSMQFGLERNTDWGGSRDGREPQVPHHALHDARAQRHDLVALLTKRDR